MSKIYNEFTFSVTSTTESKIDKIITNSPSRIEDSKNNGNRLFKVAFGVSAAVVISTAFICVSQSVPTVNNSSINMVKNVQSKVINSPNNSSKTINLNDLMDKKRIEQEGNIMSNVIAKKAQVAKILNTIAIMSALVLSLFFIFKGYGFGLVAYTWFAFMMTPVFFKGIELIERKRSTGNGNQRRSES